MGGLSASFLLHACRSSRFWAPSSGVTWAENQQPVMARDKFHWDGDRGKMAVPLFLLRTAVLPSCSSKDRHDKLGLKAKLRWFIAVFDILWICRKRGSIFSHQSCSSRQSDALPCHMLSFCLFECAQPDCGRIIAFICDAISYATGTKLKLGRFTLRMMTIHRPAWCE